MHKVVICSHHSPAMQFFINTSVKGRSVCLSTKLTKYEQQSLNTVYSGIKDDPLKVQKTTLKNWGRLIQPI